MRLFQWIMYAALTNRDAKGLRSVLLTALIRSFEWGFQLRYVNARQKMVKTLMLMLFHRFRKYPDLEGVSMGMVHGPGYSENEDGEICWETPLGLTLWNTNGPIFGLGIEFRGRFICIRQMQGVSRTHIPPEFRDWPVACVRLMMRFARLTGFRGVRIYHAHTSFFYRFPELNLPEGADRKEEIRLLRQRMRHRYDGTARKLKFRPTKDFSVWLCPPRRTRPS
jgi:hypothetical protein